MSEWPVTKSYQWDGIAALTLVYTLNYFDLGLITLLLQPIKEGLQLFDSELGFLTGIPFGSFAPTTYRIQQQLVFSF